jgi:hypothetical protein
MSFFSQPKLHQSSPPHSPQFSHRFPYENRQSRRVDEGKSRWNHRGYKSNQSNQFEQTFVRLSDGSFAIRPDSSQDDIKNKSIHQTRFNDDDDDDVSTQNSPKQYCRSSQSINVDDINSTQIPSSSSQNNIHKQFNTTVSDDVEDETPFPSLQILTDILNQTDIYDPLDINSPLIIDVPQQNVQTDRNDPQWALESPVGFYQPLTAAHISPKPTIKTPIDIPISSDVRYDVIRVEVMIQDKTGMENCLEDSKTEQSLQNTDTLVDNANNALLNRLFNQNEELYKRRRNVLGKIRNMGENNLAQTNKFRTMLKQIDALIEQTHTYTHELLHNGVLVE